MSGISLGELLAIAAAVTNSTVFNAPGLSLAAGLVFLLLCGLAFGFGLAASLTMGLHHLLVVSLSCCNRPRLLLVAVFTIANGICPSSWAVQHQSQFNGTIISSDAVLAGKNVHHDLSPPTMVCDAGLRGTLSEAETY